MGDDARAAICRIIQGDIPREVRPYARMGEMVGITEREVIDTVRDLVAQGLIRRFGAILRHREAGVTANAMVVWAVPPWQSEDVGSVFSRFAEVSHCYERTPAFAGRYTLFTMIHAVSGGVQAVVEKMKEASGIADCLVLESVEEFKKASMEYFP
jgi:siroheme decarboxylase